ncbi:MAG: hypothetical protein HOL85_16795 [Rhodospirillaceae bacterium]|nr:hypothetical protein [Rhodospirillaceae bacterium]
MMEIGSTTSQATTTPVKETALAKLSSDMDMFLSLLTTQLQNQDPLNPMDTKDMTAQLVQFAGVEQQIKQGQNLEKLVNLQTARVLDGAQRIADTAPPASQPTQNPQSGQAPAIEGKIASQTRDGQVTVETRNGPVTLQFPRNAAVPANGTSVSLTIAPTSTTETPSVMVKVLAEPNAVPNSAQLGQEATAPRPTTPASTTPVSIGPNPTGPNSTGTAAQAIAEITVGRVVTATVAQSIRLNISPPPPSVAGTLPQVQSPPGNQTPQPDYGQPSQSASPRATNTGPVASAGVTSRPPPPNLAPTPTVTTGEAPSPQPAVGRNLSQTAHPSTPIPSTAIPSTAIPSTAIPSTRAQATVAPNSPASAPAILTPATLAPATSENAPSGARPEAPSSGNPAAQSAGQSKNPGMNPTNAPSTTSGAIAAPHNPTAPTTPVGMPAGTPAGTPAQTFTLPHAGTSFSVRVASIEMPGAPLNPPASSIQHSPQTTAQTTGQTNSLTNTAAPALGIVSGTVSGLTSNGQAIVETQSGVLTLEGGRNLPPGTLVRLEALADTTPRGVAPDVPPPPAPIATLLREWPALQDALAALQANAPAQAAQVLTESVARPGPQLAGALMFFIAAARTGDVRGWFGDAASRALEQIRVGALGSLGEDMATMQRASDTSESGWRGFMIPLFDGEQLSQLRFLVHQDGGNEDDDEAEDKDRDTRFMVDLSLSRLGDFRLDGMVHENAVELLIRTKRPLPDDMRSDIFGIFERTLARTGVTGQLAFRSEPVFPPLPVKELTGYDDAPSSDLTI